MRFLGWLLAITIGLLAGCAPAPQSAPKVEVPRVSGLELAEPQIVAAFDEARQRLERLQAQEGVADRDLAWAWGRYGMVLYVHGQLEAARTGLAEARRLDPDDRRWGYYLGLCLRELGAHEEAYAALLAVATVDRESVALRVRLGDFAADLDRPEDARGHFREALELDRDCAAALLGLGRLELDEGRLDEAREHLEAAHALQPRAGQIRHALAAARRSGGDVAGAAAIIDGLRISNLAETEVQLDDPLLAQLDELQLSSQVIGRRGQRALLQGNWPVAIREFRRALEHAPSRTDFRYNVAAALVSAGRPAEARSELEALIENAPSEVLPRILLVRVLIGSGELDNAEAVIAGLGELDPGDARSELVAAELARARGREESALIAYRRAGQLDPASPAPALGLAELYLDRGDLEAARSKLAEAEDLGADRDALQRLARRIDRAAGSTEFSE